MKTPGPNLCKQKCGYNYKSSSRQFFWRGKQRIAFARAIYRDPDVLILDEITSNIDDKSAREIYARVNEERNKRITFIISHDDLPGEISNKEITL